MKKKAKPFFEEPTETESKKCPEKVRVHVRSYHVDKNGKSRVINAHVGKEGITYFYFVKGLNYEEARGHARMIHHNLDKKANPARDEPSQYPNPWVRLLHPATA